MLPRRFDSPQMQEAAFWALSAWLAMHELKWDEHSAQSHADTVACHARQFLQLSPQTVTTWDSLEASTFGVGLLLACVRALSGDAASPELVENLASIADALSGGSSATAFAALMAAARLTLHTKCMHQVGQGLLVLKAILLQGIRAFRRLS